ncbi:redoxin domain-containing protein [Streptomyces indicus]|uniref:Thiol-disulfide isomerase or thioredoxin n=1 Tax=Streptomyces indicus TaxID=417292 RepID=A0A1G8URC8_9ACTN|nr:redoxin domain-containing protein [Streptomyces indicus]SDJ56412.1 Thiol-disulfide isomerase or thioredoxin [Streptomyces indicus]
MRPRTAVPALLTAALLTAAATGCGTEEPPAAGTDKPAARASSTPAAPSTTPPSKGGAEVPEALRFTGTTVDGKEFDAATLAGKPVVLWFWAPWCPKCRAQAAETASVAADFAGKAHVLGVAGLDGNDAMREFVAGTGTGGFPHLSDGKGEIWRRFEVTEQSRYVILDGDGKQVYEGVLPAGKGLADKLTGLTG